MAKVIEERPVTIWDEFTMQRDSDSPVQLRLPYTPEEWTKLTNEEKEANRQAEFEKWQANIDALRAEAAAREEAPPEVPASITMSSAQRVMFNAGIIDTVIAMVKQAGPDVVAAFWTSQTMERNNQFLLAISPLIWPDLSEQELSDQLDAMFLQGDRA